MITSLHIVLMWQLQLFRSFSSSNDKTNDLSWWYCAPDSYQIFFISTSFEEIIVIYFWVIYFITLYVNINKDHLSLNKRCISYRAYHTAYLWCTMHNRNGLGYFRRRHFRRMHFRRRDFRRMEHWSNGTLVEWNIGRMEHWSNGTLVEWNIGRTEHSSNLT